MLSNIEIILLRLVKSSPSYAYEIEKMMVERNMNDWVKVGGTTVYQVLDRLARKGLLAYDVEKEGNMPERKRYYITPEGDRQFMYSAKEKLRHFEKYYLDLNVGLLSRHFLEDSEFKEIIAERLEELNAFIRSFNERFENARELYPSKRYLVREYVYGHYLLEQEFLQKLLVEKAGE